MKTLLALIGFIVLVSTAEGQTITSTHLHDDFSAAQTGSDVTYTTLYPGVYTLTRDTLNDQFQVHVTPQSGFWRPIVIGFGTANGGNGLDISANPILKAHIVVPDTASSPLKLAFYISDGSTLGEYDDVTPEEYVRANLMPGTDTIFEFDWTHAKQVDWGAGGWPPTTTFSPDLSSLESLGMSMNTNSSDTGTYIVKSIELGGVVAHLPDLEVKEMALVYPNPVNGNTAYFRKTYESVILYDLSGTEIKNNSHINKIDLTDLPAGMYTLMCDGAPIRLFRN